MVKGPLQKQKQKTKKSDGTTPRMSNVIAEVGTTGCRNISRGEVVVPRTCQPGAYLNSVFVVFFCFVFLFCLFFCSIFLEKQKKTKQKTQQKLQKKQENTV